MNIEGPTFTLILSGDISAAAQQYICELILNQAGVENTIRIISIGEPGLYLSSKLVLAGSEIKDFYTIVTLQGELKSGQFDGYGRSVSQLTESQAAQPLVSVVAWRLRERLSELGLPVIKQSANFSVICSHDVDRVTSREWTYLAKSVYNQIMHTNSEILPLFRALDTKLYLRNLERLLTFEHEQGIGGYYFFLSGSYGTGRYENRYSINSKLATTSIERVVGNGGTIGLHGSYFACDHDTYAEEAERLRYACRQPVTTHRNHYLRFDPINLWTQLERAGIRYDFSVGFPNRMGYRSGLTGPYNGFDIKRDTESGITEIPLILMDRTYYLDDMAKSLNELKALLEPVARNGGAVSILIHPESFVQDERWYEFYQEFITIARSFGADLSGKLTPWVNL